MHTTVVTDNHYSLNYHKVLVISTELDSPTHQITKEDVDQFKKGRVIPECQLVVQWERDDLKPVRLRQKVDLTGAKAPHTYIHLILNPGSIS